jgi:hypothetical protein
VAAPIVPGVALAVLFGEQGSEPFVASSFWPALATTLAVYFALPREERVLRAAALLYALATIASYVLDTPMGGNVTRLGAIAAGPLLACTLWPRHARLLALLAIPLLYWQWSAPIRDWHRGSNDPSVDKAYYADVRSYFKSAAEESPIRIEVPFTANHWEARWLGSAVPLARGWERQLDLKYNDVFYEGKLTAARYRAWLDEAGVSFVALPDAALDGSAKAEAALIRGGLGYLHEVYDNPHWRVFVVDDAAPLATGGRLTQLGTDDFTIAMPSAGTAHVRVRFTPYWQVSSGRGCVRRDGDWTAVTTKRPGILRVSIGFSPQRIWDHGPRCR